MTPPQRLAVIFDAVEERWPSMEYAAEMLLKHLQTEHSDQFASVAVRPRFFRGFERAPFLSERRHVEREQAGDPVRDVPLGVAAEARRFRAVPHR